MQRLLCPKCNLKKWILDGDQLCQKCLAEQAKHKAKKCSQCNQLLPLSNFVRCWSTPSDQDGYFNFCQDCADQRRDDNDYRVIKKLFPHLRSDEDLETLRPIGQ